MHGTEHSLLLRAVLRFSGLAFLIAVTLTPVLRDVFRVYNVVDRPGFRKVHAYPIPRMGGIAVAVAYSIALARLGSSDLLWQIVPGAAIIFGVGILDDFFNLPAGYKFLGQIAAASLAYWDGLRVPGPAVLSFALTVFWLVLCANAFNLIDGLDGLCAGLGCTGALGLFLMALFRGEGKLEAATLPLAGAMLGFLCHNFIRATIFLGDLGALLIGYVLGSCSILWSMETGIQTIMIAPLFALAVPLEDVFLSVLRRLVARHPLFLPDRAHVHHRLLDRGLKAPKVLLVLCVWGLCCSALAWAFSYPPLHAWRWPILGGFLLMTLAGIQQLRYPEFKWRWVPANPPPG